MTTIRLPGWYCDAHPDGRYVALVTDSHIQTEHGNIPLPLPGENVLQLRLSRDGRIAGQGHHTDQAHVYAHGAWSQIGPSVGVNACVWDQQDRLLVCRRADPTSPDPTLYKLWDRFESDDYTTEISVPTGSIGIRWIKDDGTIIPAWETYADPSRGLWEYTDFGDFAIGQGAESGCWVRFADDGILRLIEPGNTLFIRVNRVGDQVSVAIWRQDTRESVMHWMTVDELRALPEVNSMPAPPPEQEPAPEPTPAPMPPTPEPIPDPTPLPLPVPDVTTMTYDRWLEEAAIIADTYHATHGEYPAPSDVAHVLYRRAFERDRFPTLEDAMAEWIGA